MALLCVQACLLTAIAAKAETTTDLEADLRRYEHNRTALNTIFAPLWVPPPIIRSSASILYSCIVTLLACVYTALHLDTPAPGSSTLRRFGIKVVWVIWAIFAPELVVYKALTQLLESRRLVAELQKLEKEVDCHDVYGLQNSDPYPLVLPSRDAPFDLSYGFFVNMGGLAVQHELFSTYKTPMTVGPGLVLLLAKYGQFLRIPKSRIDNKSKANVFQKILVITQVSWMVLQCIVRKAYGLPLSLLEVHTMVHVVCAFILYGLWFKVRIVQPADKTPENFI